MLKVTWSQVAAWRMRRHHLVERAPAGSMLAVASRLCGLHAQVMSSAELTLWARVEGLERGAVQRALWEHRALVKTWAMRGTLHLLPAVELPLWHAALRTSLRYRRPAFWRRCYGITLDEVDRLTEAIAAALDGRVMTREELAEEVGRLTGSAAFRTGLAQGGWGTILKPAAFAGHLCFAPSQGQRVRFTRPDSWLPSAPQPVDPRAGKVDARAATHPVKPQDSGGRRSAVGRRSKARLADIATPIIWPDEEGPPVDQQAVGAAVTRRFLGAYGPATYQDLARWWGGGGISTARRWIGWLGEEVREVELDGARAWMLACDAGQLSPVRSVRLLPAFDQYVIGASRHAENLLPGDSRSRVYRPQGWISPVLLVNGFMQGVWRHEIKGSRVEVGIEPFVKVPASVRRAAGEEAERLAELLGCTLRLTWES